MSAEEAKGFTLKALAEGAYVMGLSTIGEMAMHVRCHYDAYFLIDNYAAEIATFDALVAGHEEDAISGYLTQEDIQRIDAQLDAVLSKDNPDPIWQDDV
jgi:hypothetical protein